MTENEAAALLADMLHEIAPEADLVTADPDLPLQEAADIDSMDFLALIAALRDRAGIEVPARDYPKLATLRLFSSYLAGATRS